MRVCVRAGFHVSAYVELLPHLISSSVFTTHCCFICVFSCVCTMGAVLGFLRLLAPSWLAQNRTATRQPKRGGSRRRACTSVSPCSSSSSDDCSFSRRSSRFHWNKSIGARRNRSVTNSTFLNHSLSHMKERAPDVFTGAKGGLKDRLRHFETSAT